MIHSNVIFAAIFVVPIQVLDLEDAMDEAAGVRSSIGHPSRGSGGATGGAYDRVDAPTTAAYAPPSKWAASRAEEEDTLRQLANARAATNELEDNLRRPYPREMHESARDRAIREMLLEEEMAKMGQSGGGDAGRRAAIDDYSEEAMLREMARDRAIQEMLLEEEMAKRVQSAGGGGGGGDAGRRAAIDDPNEEAMLREMARDRAIREMFLEEEREKLGRTAGDGVDRRSGAMDGFEKEAAIRELARERALLDNDDADQEEILLRNRSHSMGAPRPSQQFNSSPSQRQHARTALPPSDARAFHSEATDPRVRVVFDESNQLHGRAERSSDANALNDAPPTASARDRLALFKAMRKDAEEVHDNALGAPTDPSETPSNDPRSKLANFRALRAAYGRGDL